MTDRWCRHCYHKFLQHLSTAMQSSPTIKCPIGTHHPSYGATEQLLETNHTPIAAAKRNLDLLNF